MRKCNICGKKISDFAAKCPYCDSIMGEAYSADIAKKQERYSNLNTKKSVLVSFVLSLVILLFFRFIFRVPTFSIITLIEIVFEFICFVYAVILIRQYKLIDILKGKHFLVASIIVGVLFAALCFYYTTRLYGMGMFVIVGIPFFYKACGIFSYIVSGVLVSTLIIEGRFLLFKKRN